MKLVDKKLLFDNLIYESSIQRGIDYFVNYDVLSLSKYYLDNNNLQINTVYNKYQCQINISNYEVLNNFNCTCDIYKKYKKLCMHLIASFFAFNYQLMLEDDNLFYNSNDYSLGFYVDIFNEKAMIIPVFVLYNKIHFITDFNDLKNQQLTFLVNNKVHKISFSRLNNDFKEKLDFLFLSENSYIKQFTAKVYVTKKDAFYDFIHYCFANNFILINEKDNTKIVDYKKIIDTSSNEDRDVFLNNFFNKEIMLKKNYNDLFCVKSGCFITDLIFSKNANIYLINSKKDDRTIVNIVDNDDQKMGLDFYWYFNHGVTKNDFSKMYQYFNEKFNSFNWYFDNEFIEKNNLLKNNPIMSVEISYHHKVNNPIVVIKYVYYDSFYYHLNDDKNDVEKRNIEYEKKLFSKISKILINYNSELFGFVFDNSGDFLKIIKWAKLNKNNKNYEIKIAKDLVYKPKSKQKFVMHSLNDENVDFLKINWTLSGFSHEEIKQIVTAYVKKQEFLVLSDKNINLLTDIDFDDFEIQLKLFNSDFKEFLNDNVIVKKWNYFMIKDKFHDNKYINDFIDQFKNVDNLDLNCNLSLKQILKPYQIYGSKWLKMHHKLHTGSILADEMGLGKTIQSISYIDDFYADKLKHLTLIVAPSSLIYNWKKEFEKFTPSLRVAIIDGNLEKRTLIFKRIHHYDIIVVSYNLLKIDLNFFKELKFDIVIIDEGHTIKNHSTKFSKSIKTINGKHKIALTGTPMENNALELWSIFDFIMPGFLNDFSSFKKLISISDNSFYSFLKTKISPFILRRTKKDVLKELPSKIEKIVPIDFNDEQKKLYFQLLESVKTEIENTIKDKDIEKNKIYILSLLTKLRQICCSPKLVYENAQTNGSKFEVCLNLVDEIIERKEKVLIFSQFTTMIDLFVKELNKRNILYYVITGSVSKQRKQWLVDSFNKNNSIKVFLISLKAGAVGLNLTSASNVIHYDLWWNISVENQASDRTHRIGQNKNVIIYKLVINDSIEEKIIEIQNIKKNLINSILDFDNTNGENLSMKEMLSILNIKKFNE